MSIRIISKNALLLRGSTKKGSHEDIFELDGDTDKDVMKELHDKVKDATNIHVVRKLKGLIV